MSEVFNNDDVEAPLRRGKNAVGAEEEEKARAAEDAVVATKNNANVENLLFLLIFCLLRGVDMVVAIVNAREDSVITIWRCTIIYLGLHCYVADECETSKSQCFTFVRRASKRKKIN